MYRICIDAGHNDHGFDTGRAALGYREQDFNFIFAHGLAIKLKNHGEFEVIETRPTQDTILGINTVTSLQSRVEICNSNDCDLFVSIHCNGNYGQGSEIYISAKGGKSEECANIMLPILCTGIGTKNRGVKVGNLFVVKRTNPSAVLIEVAFMDTQSDVDILAAKQEEVINSLYEGILTFLDVPFEAPASLAYLTDEIKKFLAWKWKLANPAPIFALLDTYEWSEALYRKMYLSY